MKHLKNESGFLVFDFIFALLLILGLSTVLLAVSFTMSITEAVQYMAFSISRSYYASQVSPDTQLAAAERKKEELQSLGSFRKLINSEWFDLEIETGDFSQEYGSSGTYAALNSFGTRIQMTAKVLSFSVPILGRTGDESDFKANVNSFIGREITMQECMQNQVQRGTAIQNLDPRFRAVGSFNYVSFGDNGC